MPELFNGLSHTAWGKAGSLSGGLPGQCASVFLLFQTEASVTALRLAGERSFLNESIEDHPQFIFTTFLWTFYPIYMASVLAWNPSSGMAR